MIVFPLILSAGLKAATASSRAATWPMFVRSRPTRTRWTSSLNWAESGTTTKSMVRPPAGRASVGPVTVTSLPPARITPTDRFAMLPPEDIENQIDLADVFQGVVIEVDELLCAKV